MIDTYKYIKCLHPQRVFNKYTGEFILAECGKCEACLMKKNLSRKTRCQLENISHKYCYFVTLTYSNEYLPLLKLEYNYEADFYDVCLYRENVSYYDKEKKDWMYKTSYNGAIIGNYIAPHGLYLFQLSKKVGLSYDKKIYPCLNSRDLQLFMKRLRKRTNERIRFYACGEYGPIHFRPHYHLLLWFEREETIANIQQNISESWPFGITDFSACAGKAASYVASYVNCSQYLPEILRFPETSPFGRHSRYLGEYVFDTTDEEFQEFEPLRINRRRVCCAGLNTDIVLWRSIKDRKFPKCKGYSSKSEYERIYSYRINEIASGWSGETSPLFNSRLITDYIRYHDAEHPVPIIEDMLQYFLNSARWYHYEIQGYELFRKRMKSDEFQRFKKSLVSSGKFRYEIVKHYSEIKDWDKFERMVYMELSLSRRFIRDNCDGDSSYTRVLSEVRKIDEFYKTVEYENLKNQEISLRETSKENQKFFFQNTLSVKSLENTQLFRDYRATQRTMFKNFMKHKELNDKNLMFNK